MYRNNVTLLIPTKNRHTFLRRTLMYYKNLDFEGHIAILDSSVGEDLVSNQRLIQEVESTLSITYNSEPTMSELVATGYLVNSVTTPYLAELQDDNYLVPTSLEKCTSFLDQNPDYSACTGIGISIKTQDSKPHGPIKRCAVKNQPSSEHTSSSLRYLSLMQNYSDIHFAIHRTPIYQNAFKFSDYDDSLFFKILATAQVFLAGKVKKLDVLHLVRHIQDRPYKTKEASDLYYWITQDNWLNHLAAHRDSVVASLITKDSLTRSEAETIFKKGMMVFLLWLLIERLPNEIDLDLSSLSSPQTTWNYFSRRSSYDAVPIKIIDRTFRTFRFYYESISTKAFNRDVINNPILRTRTEFVLPALVNPKSKHQDDFLPIFDSVTTLPRH